VSGSLCGTAEAVPYKDRLQGLLWPEFAVLLGEMFYQLSWTTLPGLRGLACSEFRATPTEAPDVVRGVAVEFASEAERDALLTQLEAHFGPQRFMNTAAAFDSVKDYIAMRMTKR
jgi:hypothetical protein